MVPQTPGNLTVSYILNIPEASTTSVASQIGCLGTGWPKLGWDRCWCLKIFKWNLSFLKGALTTWDFITQAHKPFLGPHFFGMESGSKLYHRHTVSCYLGPQLFLWDACNFLQRLDPSCWAFTGSAAEVEEKVKSETPAKFGTRVAKFIDMYVGAGVYTQEALLLPKKRLKVL